MRNKHETYRNYGRVICLCQGAQKIFSGGIKDGSEKPMSDNN